MLAPNLSVTIAGIKMKNPLTVGSGTYGHHGRFNQFFPVETMGGASPEDDPELPLAGKPGAAGARGARRSP